LAIGRSFVKIERRWWTVLAATETKEKRADERPVHELLTRFIESYLSRYRALLVRPDNASSVLWVSAKDGTPITANHVTDLINATTLSTVGVAVSPHLFRTAVASTAAIYGGENPHLGSALLHHTDSNLINEHYNRAGSLTAAESFRQIVRQYERKPRGAATPAGVHEYWRLLLLLSGRGVGGSKAAFLRLDPARRAYEIGGSSHRGPARAHGPPKNRS
jgi:hypothetical protein